MTEIKNLVVKCDVASSPAILNKKKALGLSEEEDPGELDL